MSMTGAGGIEMNTTITAENAAVAAKISVLELVPCVRKINAKAKIMAKPARHINRFLSPWSCDRIEIAMTGRRHATTVEIAEVTLKAVLSPQDSSVSSFSTFGTQLVISCACVDAGVTAGSVSFFFFFQYFRKRPTVAGAVFSTSD